MFLNVSSNCLPVGIQSHTGCICLTFLHCAFPDWCATIQCPARNEPAVYPGQPYLPFLFYLYFSQISKCIWLKLQIVFVPNCSMLSSQIAKCICLKWTSSVSRATCFLPFLFYLTLSLSPSLSGPLASPSTFQRTFELVGPTMWGAKIDRKKSECVLSVNCTPTLKCIVSLITFLDFVFGMHAYFVHLALSPFLRWLLNKFMPTSLLRVV